MRQIDSRRCATLRAARRCRSVPGRNSSFRAANHVTIRAAFGFVNLLAVRAASPANGSAGNAPICRTQVGDAGHLMRRQLPRARHFRLDAFRNHLAARHRLARDPASRRDSDRVRRCRPAHGTTRHGDRSKRRCPNARIAHPAQDRAGLVRRQRRQHKKEQLSSAQCLEDATPVTRTHLAVCRVHNRVNAVPGNGQPE